jgi:hypothetical protein
MAQETDREKGQAEEKAGQEVLEGSSASPGDRPEERRSSYDELAEHLKSVEGPEHDIAMLLALNWQRLLGALALVLLAVWLVGEGMESSQKRKAEAAQYFSGVQQSFASLVDEASAPEAAGEGKNTEPEERKENAEQAGKQDSAKDSNDAIARARTSFNDNLSLLEESFQGNVYAELAGLYRALESMEQSDIKKAREVLSPFKVETGLLPRKGDKKGLAQEDFSRELAALLYARVMLLDPAQNRAELRSYVKGLVENASFINIEALVFLFRLSDSSGSSPEEREEALLVARKLSEARSELREAISLELSSMGLSLDS